MSNLIAGDIFERVIQEVINASQNDFEENGVQQQTLTELQQSWQHKLSQRKIAQMPWDPKPAPPPPPPQAQQPTPSPINPPVQNGGPPPMQQQPQQHQQQQQQQQQHQPVPTAQPVANGRPQIKSEPGQEGQQMHNYPPQQQQQGYPPQANPPMAAQQRAASLLQQQFGQQANASLNAMQQRGIALPGGAPNVQQQQQQQRPQGLQLPGQNGGQPVQHQQQHQQQSQQQHHQQQQQQQHHQQQQQQRQMQAHAQAQYANQMRQQTAHQQPNIKTEGNGQYPQGPQQPGANYSQTDGADDKALDEWNSYMAKRRQVSESEVAQNDRMMRDAVEALRVRMDNGLMLPLSQHKSGKSRKRGAARGTGQGVVSTCSLPTIPQLDGDAEEEDEDAINSDLDSSNDGNELEDEDDEEIDSMLCTYDKVQRVKNKWKCTLKDGVLLANGKEYLFHKAQGEFEW